MLSGKELQCVGKTGRFIPVKAGYGGGVLLRVHDDKRYAAAGSKGHLWHEATGLKQYEDSDKLYEMVDYSYFEALTDKAVKAINKYGDFESFVR